MAETKPKSGSQILIDVLLQNNIDVCWGYPGGAILPFYDVLFHSKIKHYLVRHEQGSVHAAEGYAKATGKIGLCISTSGPGATNLITGITDAKSDSVPILALTGQVGTAMIGTDAFQECDTFGMSIPITKYNALLKRADDVARVTQEAITVALSGRPGPSLIDFPRDVQLQMSTIFKADLKVPERHYTRPPVKGDLDKLVDAINKANKPLFYVGGGAITANAAQNLRKLAEKANVPVYMTLMGLGAFPGQHELSLGMAGMHGMAYANKAIQECDLMVALGSRFDDRVALNVNDYGSKAVRAMVDIDSAEINKRVPVDIHVSGDLNEVLELLSDKVKKQDRKNWIERITRLKNENPLRCNLTPNAIKPQYVMHRLWQKTLGKAIISTDVGQHQMWAAQYYPFNEPRQWLTSGGLGTMGFGFPAAIGAKIGKPEKDVFVITGDGSFQMNIQELATARMYNIPVKILLFNNGFLGMVRQWQELFYENRFSHSDMDYNPDFVKIAGGYDVPAMRISKPDEIEKGLDFLISTKDVCILEVTIPKEEKVYPMIASGARYEQMVEYSHESEQGEPFTVTPNVPAKAGEKAA